MYKIAVFCVLGLVMPVSAIVVDDYVTAENAPSAADSALDLDWGYVYNYKGSSAVSVGGGWLLTAGHVADDGGSGSLTIGTNVYQQQEIVPHPSADLALVRYDKAFPGHYDLYTGDTPALTKQLLMVGYGTTGTVSNNFWTGSNSGRGTKRWGSQRINSTNSGGDEFVMKFNSFSTTYEAGAGDGDSGGGVFYKDGDTWKLAGINRSIGGIGGDRFDLTNAMSMPYYADWVMDTMDTIPEPAAIGLMGFGTIGLFLARTKRRRKLPGRSVFPIRRDEPLCDRFDAKEGSEKVEKRACADYLADMLEMIHTSLLSVWMNTLHTRHKAFSNAVGRFFMAVFERASERKATVQERSEIALARGLDAFLEGISWGRMVRSVKVGRAKTVWSVKAGMRKGLDVFLEIVRWEQMESAFTRFKRGIRFYRHDD